MFKKLLAVAATLLLAAGISVIAVAAPASAHTPSYAANCDNLWFQATAYETRSGNPTPNTLKIVIDGSTVLDTKFGASFVKQTFKYDGTTAHTYSIVIDAVGGTNNTQYDKTITGVTTPCSYPKRDMAVDCSAVTVNWGAALTNELHINMRLETPKGEITVNAYIDLNVTGGYKTYGLRINGYDPIPLTEQQVKSGKLVFDYPVYVKKAGYESWAVKWVQVNEMHFNQDEKGEWIYCNWSTPTDAAAEVTVLPASCTAGESLVLGTITNAAWGKVDGAYTVVATALTGHLFPAGDGVSKDGTTKTFTGTLAGILNPNAPPCATKAVPVKPTVVTVSECGTSGSVTPVAVTGVDYAVTFDSASGDYVVTATPKAGYYFEGDADQKITFEGNAGAYYACSEKPDATIAYGECVYAADGKAEPRTVRITFDNSRSNKAVLFQVPYFPEYDQKVAAGDSITFEVANMWAAGGGYSVTAGTSTFELTVPPCDEPVKPEPKQRVIVTELMTCSTSDVEVTTTTYTTDWVFDVATTTWAPGVEGAGVVVITHRAMTSDEASTYCGTKVETDPSASTCTKFDLNAPYTSWIYVALDPKVVYTITDANASSIVATSAYTALPVGTYTVTAVAAPGYVLQPSASKSWTFTVADTDKCQLPSNALVTPMLASTAMTCKASGSYTLGELTPGTIVWTVNGVVSPAGTYKVTSAQTVTLVATPKNASDGLDAAWKSPQILTFEESAGGCQLTTLALTGSTRTLGYAAIGTLLILGGIGFWIVRRRLAPTA